MSEIMYQKTYQEYKAELDGELQRTAEGFVRIGYLLKVARDTNVLAESGYHSVTEFAQAEYNLDKTQVSRFIRINDKFSENGYSDRLMSNYQGFGYAKLTIMLQLPDAINEGLTTGYSKAEIQSIKEEYEEESKKSDIEVLLEAEQTEDSLVEKAIKQLANDSEELYLEVAESIEKSEWDEDFAREIMAPAGEKTYSVRVAGVGRIMLMLSEDSGRAVNSRTGEYEEITWQQITEAWEKLVGNGDIAERYESLFCKKLTKCEQIAPVQSQEDRMEEPETKPKAQPKAEPKKEPKKESKVVKAKTEPKAETKVEPKTEQQEEQIPGQDSVLDHPEWLPSDNTIRGYRASVTQKLNKLQKLWGEDQYKEMREVLKEIDETLDYILKAERETE